MTSPRALLLISATSLAGSVAAQESAADKTAAVLDPVAIEADIEAALVNRVDEARNTVGIVVGILAPDGRRYLTRGVRDRESGAALTADTIFEIGSITKVFTSLLLADMVERGEVALDDPVEDYLPDSVTVPSYNGRHITLMDLATHTAGLPRMLPVPNPANVGAARMYEFLSGYTLLREPGEQFEYSSLGVGLLGHVLSLRAGLSYEELLRTRVFEPLGMDSTTITLSDEQRRRMATGYDNLLNATGSTEFDALAGAGAIRSTAEDLLTFAAAQLGLTDHPLRFAMRRMVSVSRSMPPSSLASNATVHLGWIELDDTVLFHNGATPGYFAALAVRPDVQRAVVVLGTGQTDDSIAIHGVRPEHPLRTFEPLPDRVEIELSEDVLETYVGTYRGNERWSYRIRREGGRLIAQRTWLGEPDPPLELGATSEREFFDKNNPLLGISFVKDDAGVVTGLIVHRGASDFRAQRIEDVGR